MLRRRAPELRSPGSPSALPPPDTHAQLATLGKCLLIAHMPKPDMLMRAGCRSRDRAIALRPLLATTHLLLRQHAPAASKCFQARTIQEAETAGPRCRLKGLKLARALF